MDRTAQAAARCALALLDALDDGQGAQVRGSLADPQLTKWTYLPGDRPGLSMEDLTSAQHALVLELLHASLPPAGVELAVGAVEVERVRRHLVTGTPPSGDRYWVRVLGDPAGDDPWGWRINGHHLAVHVVVAGDAMTVTPHFVGSEPAVVPSGPGVGHRLLGPEEDLARELASGLDPDQRTLGISDAEEAGLDRIRFAWAGPTEPGEGHYYCVTTPHFLIEYDNTQDDANHAHSVWRHLRDDWGADLLRDHYARHHVDR